MYIIWCRRLDTRKTISPSYFIMFESVGCDDWTHDKWMRDSCTLQRSLFDYIKDTWPAPCAVIVTFSIIFIFSLRSLHRCCNDYALSALRALFCNFEETHSVNIGVIVRQKPYKMPLKCFRIHDFKVEFLPSGVLFGVRYDISFWTWSRCFSNPEERIGTGAIVCKWFDKYCWFIDSIHVTLETVEEFYWLERKMEFCTAQI